MNKGVEGSVVGPQAPPQSPAAIESADGAGERVIRRRRRHHRHQNLTRRSGRAREIAFVTVLALGLLFGILYYLLPHYQAQNTRGEESIHKPPAYHAACQHRLG